MKHPNLLLALWCILLVLLSACNEKRDLPKAKNQTIASFSIRHTTPKLVRDSRLSPLISSQPGTIYSEDKIDNDIKSLWDSGLVEDVKFLMTSSGDSVDLIASISTRRGFGPVLLRGNTSFSDQMLWKQVSEPLAARISQAVTVVFDPLTDEPIVHSDRLLVGEVLPAVCRELEQFYRREGFQDAKVRTESWNGESPTADDFVFVIDERSGEE
jgi:outer membrane protein assembly factor BamA